MIITNLAELKRIRVGDRLRLVYRFGKILDEPREVAKVQTNAIAFKKGDGLTWLEFPPASRLEFTDRGFRTYAVGRRPLTPQEQEVLDNEPRDPKQEEIDALSDGSTMYWRTKAYLEAKGMPYLSCGNREKQLVWVDKTPMIQDPAVKGQLELEYMFEGDGNGALL